MKKAEWIKGWLADAGLPAVISVLMWLLPYQGVSKTIYYAYPSTVPYYSLSIGETKTISGIELGYNETYSTSQAAAAVKLYEVAVPSYSLLTISATYAYASSSRRIVAELFRSNPKLNYGSAIWQGTLSSATSSFDLQAILGSVGTTTSSATYWLRLTYIAEGTTGNWVATNVGLQLNCGSNSPSTPTTTAPGNDNFSSATTISGASGSKSGSNAGATVQTSEPRPSAQSNSGSSVWYKWTAPSSGTATFDTIGSSFDTVLAVYTGSSVSSLSEVKSDDDGGGSGNTSKLTFDAAAETTYRIAVYGYSSKNGNLTLNWKLESTPTTQTSLTYAKTHELESGAYSPFSVGLTLGGGGFSINSATFSTSASWIRYSGYALRNSDLTLKFNVDANTDASQRTATFSGVVNGESVTITFRQAGQGQTSGGDAPVPTTPAASTSGSMSQFEISSGVVATIVGMPGVTWGDFNSTDYFGTRTFTNENIPDAEKSKSGFTMATMGAEDGWCGPLSDMDALYWTGWAQAHATGYATVEDMADYFRARPSLLRTWSSYEGPVEGTYGYDGLFDWFKNETGMDVSQHVTRGDAQSVSFAWDVQTLLGDGGHVMRIDLLFNPVANNPKWTWVNAYGGTLHAVLCVGFAVDTTRSSDDPAKLAALFIVDPDNDQSTGSGGRSAPNSIVYCPVTWNGGECVVSGIWGQDSVVYGTYAALAMSPSAVNGGNGTGGGASSAPKLDTSIGGILATDFVKAQSPQGALVGADGNLAGTVQVKASKKSNKGIVKISATATLMNGKKVNARPISLNVGSGAKSGKLVFNGIGEMDFEMTDNGTFTLKGGSYAMASAKVGGNLPNGKMTFAVDIDSLPAVDAGFVVLDDLLPDSVEVTVTGGKKIDAGKAAMVKYAKDKASGQFSLVGLDDPKKPNRSGLKLIYTPKTGVFKGSFNMYATNEGSAPAGRAPKLKKYRVNVTGFMVDDGTGLKGVGEATIKKPAAKWSATIK